MKCPNCGKGDLTKVKHYNESGMSWNSYHCECKSRGGCGWKSETEIVNR